MDSNIRNLLRSNNIRGAFNEAKRAGCVQDYEYPVEGTIKYIYHLYGHNRFHIYGETIDDLISNTVQLVDDGTITSYELGCMVREGNIFAGPSPMHDWAINMVPSIKIFDECVAIKESELFPSIPTSVDTASILEKVYVASKKIQGHNNDALNKLNEKQRRITEQKKASELKIKRRERLNVVKEALNISPEYAETYAGSIKDDPEFTKIASILIGKARAGK